MNQILQLSVKLICLMDFAGNYHVSSDYYHSAGSYDSESADEEDYEVMDREARLVAEAKMRRRDREKGMPTAFLDDGMK